MVILLNGGEGAYCKNIILEISGRSNLNLSRYLHYFNLCSVHTVLSNFSFIFSASLLCFQASSNVS